MNAGAELYGIIYSYADTSGYEMKLNGGATTYGAIIADENVLVKAATGTYNAVYDAEVLSNIASGGDFLYIARVSGSWRDGE